MTVTVTRAGHVATVTFARPPANHICVALLRDLADAFAEIDADPDLRASVLRSEGKIFCAGADLDPAAADAPADRDFTSALYAQAIRLFETHKPIVAAVQGAAVGAGLGWRSLATSGSPRRKQGSAPISCSSASTPGSAFRRRCRA